MGVNGAAGGPDRDDGVGDGGVCDGGIGCDGAGDVRISASVPDDVPDDVGDPLCGCAPFIGSLLVRLRAFAASPPALSGLVCAASLSE